MQQNVAFFLLYSKLVNYPKCMSDILKSNPQFFLKTIFKNVDENNRLSNYYNKVCKFLFQQNPEQIKYFICFKGGKSS